MKKRLISKVEELKEAVGKRTIKEEKETYRIYIADLAAYNAGKLVGEWVKLPDEAAVQKAIDKYSYGGEIDTAIHDFELPFKIDENEDPLKVNALVEIMVEKDMPGSVMAWIFDNYGSDDLDKIKEIAENLSFGPIDSDSDRDIGYHLTDVFGGVDQLDRGTLEQYFDYESYGHDADLNGEITVVGSFSKGWYAIEPQSVYQSV